MKEIEVDGFCFGENHKRCYFFKEIENGKKFCGLWMRGIKGALNPRKNCFRCTFCNARKVTIESNGGPVFNDNVVDTIDGSISITNT